MGDPDEDEDDELNPHEQDGERLRDEPWQRLARFGVDEDADLDFVALAAADRATGPALGERDLDKNHDWDAALEQYGGLESLLRGTRWVEERRGEDGHIASDLEFVDPDTLSLD